MSAEGQHSLSLEIHWTVRMLELRYENTAMPNDNLDIIGVRITGRKTHQIRQGRKAFSCKSASPVRKSSGYTKHGLSLRHSPLTSPMRTSNMESKHKV
jgi:hypothetical protein